MHSECKVQQSRIPTTILPQLSQWLRKETLGRVTVARSLLTLDSLQEEEPRQKAGSPSNYSNMLTQSLKIKQTMKFSTHNDHFCCFQSEMMTGLQVLLLFLLSVGVQQQFAMLPCWPQRLHGRPEISLRGWKRGPSVTIALYLKAHPPRVVGFLFPEFVAFSLAWSLLLVRDSHAFSIKDVCHTGPNSKSESMWVSLAMGVNRATMSISSLICPGFPAGSSAAHLASLFPVSPLQNREVYLPITAVSIQDWEASLV